ncbi:MAG: TrmH family RNA methyltransferase [Candidatus Limnocylindrales bacterium]
MSQSRITSTSNPRVRAALALRDRRARDAAGRTLVDGARETMRALEAGARVETIFLCLELVHGTEGARLLERLEGRPAVERPDVVEVGESVHDRLAYGGRGDGVVAVVEVPRRGLAELRLPADPLVAVLEGVEKPGNVGAILRTADGAGLDAVVVADAGTDLFNPNAIRASLGAVFSVALAAAPADEVRAWLRTSGWQLVLARPDASSLYDTVDYRRPTALLLGSEARGLGGAWDDPAAIAVRLPMLGRADSLNVAAAAAILFYEARRQRDRTS